MIAAEVMSNFSTYTQSSARNCSYNGQPNHPLYTTIFLDDGRMPGVYMRVVKNFESACIYLSMPGQVNKKGAYPQILTGISPTTFHSVLSGQRICCHRVVLLILILCCQCVSECVPIATLFSDEDDRGPNTVEFIYYRAKVCCTVKLVRPGNGQWMDATWPGLAWVGG